MELLYKRSRTTTCVNFTFQLNTNLFENVIVGLLLAKSEIANEVVSNEKNLSLKELSETDKTFPVFRNLRIPQIEMF